MIIGYGGTQTITGPNLYSPQAKQLFQDLGVVVKRFEKYYDEDFYKSRGMGQAIFFDKETFGTDRLVTGAYETPWPEFLPKTPLSAAAQRDLLRLYSENADYLAGMTPNEKKAYLAKTSYQDYLLKNVKVSPDVIPFFFTSMYGLYGVGIDAVPAGDMAGLGYLPGFKGLGITDHDGPGMGLEVTRQDHEPYIYHFPDGIGSVPRLLVRAMIPGVAPGNSMEDVVLAKFNYAKLDDPNSPVRVRLNSTAVQVANAKSGDGVLVTYVRGGKAHLAKSAKCILACWNMVIPYICPELPETQKQGARLQHQGAAGLHERAVEELEGLRKIESSRRALPGRLLLGSRHGFSREHGRLPVHAKARRILRVASAIRPCRSRSDRTGKATHRTHDAAEYGISSTFERNIRDQLARILGSAGFDPAADIEAITVNRWPHGYAYEYNSLYDPVWPPGQAPNEIGRQPYGNIHIANSDAGAFAYTNEAIDQGYRAVQEIVAKKA